MKRAIKLLTVVCLAISLIGSACIAAEQINVSAVYDVENMSIAVSGKSAASAGKYITIYIAHENIDINRINDENIDVLAGYRQVLCGGNGTFSRIFTIREEAENGKYIVYVKDEDGNMGQTSFPYAGKDDIETAFGIVNGAIENNASVSEIRRLTEKYEIELLLDFSEYTGLSDKNKVIELVKSQGAGGYKSFADFVLSFRKAVCTVAVSEEKTDKVIDIFEKYSNEIGVDISLINGLNEQSKAHALKILKNASYSAPEKAAEGYTEAVVCGKASKPDSYKVIKNIVLTEYKNEIGASESVLRDYGNLSSSARDDVFKYMLNLDFDSYAEIREGLANAVAAVGKSAGKGSGGGSGGSGNSQYGTIAPPVQTDNTAGTKIFNDLENVKWAEESIYALHRSGIVNGYPNGTFKPDAYITRAEFTKLIISAFGFKDSDNVYFSDLSETDWSYNYVAAGVANGLIKGFEDGTFRADDYIKREDIAVIADRVMTVCGNVTAEETETAFNDEADISDYSISCVKRLYAAGVITGDENNNFLPGGSATRAEAAVIIYRMINIR